MSRDTKIKSLPDSDPKSKMPRVRKTSTTDSRRIEPTGRVQISPKTPNGSEFVVYDGSEKLALTLENVIRAYKQSNFDSSLRAQAEELYFLVSQTPVDTSPRYWRANAIVYELNDIFLLDPKINETALRVGAHLFDELRRLSITWGKIDPITDQYRRLIKQKVIFCACGGNELRRRGDTQEALRVFEWLFEFTTTKLATHDRPCYGTLAALNYYLGAIYRIQERHNRAEDKYTQTLALLYEKSKQPTPTALDDQLFLMRKQAMAIGIGFGWVNLTRGSLRRAENALTTARSLLARSTDPVIPWYIELLYGTIKRCRAGSNKEQLEEAISSLTDARRGFEKNGHLRHVPRVCWELSLAEVAAGRYSEAQEHLNVVADYADAVDHPKWQTNSKILQSRIFRLQGDLQGALDEAEVAVLKAGDCKSTLPLIDAHITRGEAKLYLIKTQANTKVSYAEARKDFEKARGLVFHTRSTENNALPSNPKILAVCELRIAQCFAREGDEDEARQHLVQWDILRSSVEHEWVRELAADVKNEVESLSMNFTISAREPIEWDYSVSVGKLRRWLLARALRHTKRNYTEAAQLIGVQRATLYQWQDEARESTKRARTRNSSKSRKTPKG